MTGNKVQDNNFMRMVMLSAMRKAEIVDFKLAKDEEDEIALRLAGYMPSIAENVWVLFKDANGSLT